MHSFIKPICAAKYYTGLMLKALLLVTHSGSFYVLPTGPSVDASGILYQNMWTCSLAWIAFFWKVGCLTTRMSFIPSCTFNTNASACHTLGTLRKHELAIVGMNVEGITNSGISEGPLSFKFLSHFLSNPKYVTALHFTENNSANTPNSIINSCWRGRSLNPVLLVLAKPPTVGTPPTVFPPHFWTRRGRMSCPLLLVPSSYQLYLRARWLSPPSSL